MQSIVYLIVRFGSYLLFVVLQIICFYLMITYNKTQRDIYFNTTNIFASQVNERVDKVHQYLKLQEINDSLQLENALLIQKFIDFNIRSKIRFDDIQTIDTFQYQIIPSTICNQTFSQKHNTLTLCKGSQDGIQKDMGVISQNGVMGIVKQVSPHYALVLSILHPQVRISCAIKRNESHGSLYWPGRDPRYMVLDAIPKHIEVMVGDTVITSGYSTIFPKGIPVGKVDQVDIENGSNSYTLRVRLFNDPTNQRYAYVIRNTQAAEQKNLEKSIIE